MDQIKEGDYVGRKSYNMDIVFGVSRIINLRNNKKIVILKGIDYRIEADSDIEDLIKIDSNEVRKREERIKQISNKKIECCKNRFSRSVYNGKILHLDGDFRYSQKSFNYYKKTNLTAVVKNIPESRQSKNVVTLIKKYKPDILVITGHDAMLKNRKRL